MGLNYGSYEFRKVIIEEIKQNANQIEKKQSLKDLEIYKGRIQPYIIQALTNFLSEETVESMPVVSSINLAKRVVQQEASIYKDPPIRKFTGVSPEQEQALLELYREMNVNTKMRKANEMYKLQDQTHLQVVLDEGELCLRVLMRHHLDVVPNPNNPEDADAYLVNGFDRSMYAPRLSESEDGLNQFIADPEDYKSKLNRYAVWSDEFNFIMDEQGNIVSGPDVANPLKTKPFVDIACYKDYEYFVRTNLALSDFTVQFNSALSDLGHIVRMQGFAQAYWKGPDDMIPQNLQIGPSFIIKLPIDKNNPVETDFGFANPNSDIAGAINYIEMLLSTFLSSKGLDPKIISGKADATKFSSGVERLLSMIEKFEASKSDLDLFVYSEKELFEIIKAYLNTYAGSPLLKYQIGEIPQDADIEIQFKQPQMVMSEAEKLDVIQRRLDMGLISQAEAIAIDRDLPIEEAQKIEQMVSGDMEMDQPQDNQDPNKAPSNG